MSSFFSLIIFLNYFILIITIAPKDSNEDFDYLILVNKFYKLPDDYENKVNLVNATNNITDDNRTFLIENETYMNFINLRESLLQEESITIELDSVYRSVKRQQEIWDQFVREKGIDYARKYVAQPGYSEHHTGLAVDICLVVNGTVIDDNDEMIAQKEIFAKIHKKLADHGFILRFLKGKEKITGYNYEPWHFRYVQLEAAKNISNEKITLEEYLGKVNYDTNKGNILNNNFIGLILLIICLLL